MSTIIPRYAFWNPGTWQIPKLYWDAFSDEQRIHAICKQLGKVIAYADFLGTNVDDIAARLKAIEEGQLDPYIIAAIEAWFEENQPEIMAALENLNEALPIADFNAEHTVSGALSDLNSAISAVNDRFPVQTADIADESVTADKIKDGTIGADKLGEFYNDDIGNLQTQIDTIRNKDIYERKYWYCDSVNGDDQNDGLTAATAFKTFERAMRVREEGYTDINIRFLPGDYYNYDWRWTNITVHLIGYDGATMHMAPQELFNVYNCYIHFESQAQAQGKCVFTFDNGIHTDASSLWCNNVELIGGSTDSGAPRRIDCYMSSSTFIDVTFNHINFMLRNGVYSISAGEIINNDSKISRVTCQNALIGIYNLEDTTSALDSDVSTDYGYVDLQYCHASLYFDANMALPGTYKYNAFLRTRFSTVEMTNASYQRVIANSNNASGCTGHSSLIHAKTSLDIVT